MDDKGSNSPLYFFGFYTVVANKLSDLISECESACERNSHRPKFFSSSNILRIFGFIFGEEGLVVLLLSPCHVGEVLYYTIQCNTSSTRRVGMVSCFFLLLHTNCTVQCRVVVSIY
jgi:hypothetical protein